MLQRSTRKQIKEHKLEKHSNPSEFKMRLKERTNIALKDLALIFNEMDEEFIQKILNDDALQKFLESLVRPDLQKGNPSTKQSDRIFRICCLFCMLTLGNMEHLIGNKWAQQLFHEHSLKLYNMIYLLYTERYGSQKVL